MRVFVIGMNGLADAHETAACKKAAGTAQS